MSDWFHDSPLRDLSLEGVPVYPHLKLTREEFPRILATRVLNDDGDEYFGAFLTKTSVRILIDFLNRTFRLRSCDIEIDGSFPVPCTQYFAKRCVAPCVASLCSRERHAEIAHLVRKFLSNDRVGLRQELQSKMDSAVDRLDFELAAFWRDTLQSVEEYWSKPRWQVWLEDSVDTIEIGETPDRYNVTVVTQRGRRMLGNLIIEFDRKLAESEELLAGFIRRFYRFHAPLEIRAPFDFLGRRAIATELSAKFRHPVKISVVSAAAQRVTTKRALERTRHESLLKTIARPAPPADIANELKVIFNLPNVPTRIEAIDAAHISSSLFTAAAVVWENGEFVREEFEHFKSEESSELGTISSFAAHRYSRTETALPDLVLVDGGKNQLAAAIEGAKKSKGRPVKLISAVKPRGKHSEISKFLIEEGHEIRFDQHSPGHRLLKLLRDEAHDLANAVHRLNRDMLHFYEKKGVEPLIVPIRFDAVGGDAGDLRPIITQ